MKPSYIKGHKKDLPFIAIQNFANASAGKSYETASFHSQRRNRSHVFARIGATKRSLFYLKIYSPSESISSRIVSISFKKLSSSAAAAA